MDAKEFNELIKLHKYDKEAKYKLCLFCLEIIKKRLIFKNGVEDLDNISYSVLQYFLLYTPKYYVFAPCKYLNKCTDNYLSSRKKNKVKSVELTDNIAYEQMFENLENFEVMRVLRKNLDELNAKIVYMHIIEEAKEYEIAERLGVELSYSAIRQRISRSLKILKKYYTENVTKNN